MQKYKIADLITEMDPAGTILSTHSKAYLSNEIESGDISLHISPMRLQKAQSDHPQLSLNEWEYLLTGMDFAKELLSFNGFCLHASAISLDQQAILFSGPSGIGKSTQAGLWQQYFGADRTHIINDDKPAIRLLDNKFYAYGTPWSGKSNLNSNIKVPIQAIVFIRQSGENRIIKLNNKEAVKMLIYQSIRPIDHKGMDKFLFLLDELIKCIPIYQLDCKIGTDSVELLYEEIKR